MKHAPSGALSRASLLACASLCAVATARAQAPVATSFGTGADTYLVNDANLGPTIVNGAKTVSNLRYNLNSRCRQPLLRFDLSGVNAGSDLSGATLSLTFTRSNRARTVNVYGLRDEALDSWSEATTSYSNAPGVPAAGATLPTPLGQYSYDIYDATTNPTGEYELLGTFQVTNLAVPYTATSSTTTLNLDAFLAADTNKKVTFLILSGSDGSADWDIAAKEGYPINQQPTLTLPNAVADTDVDGLSDPWEIANFGNLTAQNGTGDPDLDTFDNETEETAKSDPDDILSVPGDIDGDALADLWEDQHFGNNDTLIQPADLTPQNGTGDADNDLYTNEEEETNLTLPNSRASFVDSDTDLLNDAWENLFFFNLAAASDPLADNDADTFNNQAEYDAFSNPNNVDSLPGDIDGDDLADLWEDKYFGNNNGLVTAAELLLAIGTEDADSDTFDNETEETTGSSPVNPLSVPSDNDADALVDSWEITHFGTIATQNGNDDSDGDSYTNEEEETAATIPSDKSSFIDSEPDGLNDNWEIANFGNLTTAGNPAADPDGDTVSNNDEYLAGSDPNVASSVPGDIDGDNLADSFELASFATIWDYDGNDDPDLDFSTNEEEEVALTLPGSRASYPDSDLDLLGDGWEIFSFGDLTTTNDPALDTDVDTFTDGTEFAAATDGGDPLDTTDTDGDGLSDGWEIAHFTNITAQTGQGDPDADGADNQLEQLDGTIPTSNASIPVVGRLSVRTGNGADTQLTNDGQNAASAPGVAHGLEPVSELRITAGARIKVPMFRFDLSRASGDLSRASLRINCTFGNPFSTGTVTVYGLVDSNPGNNWDEGLTSYSNAPGIGMEDAGITVTTNRFLRDPRQLRPLGTFVNQPGGQTLASIRTLDLTDFIAEDTDGLITLVLINSANRWNGVTMRESNDALEPQIVFPAAVIDNSMQTPLVTAFTFNPAANLATFALDNLEAYEPYHLESFKKGDAAFAPVAGSTFTPLTPAWNINTASDEAVIPMRLFRVVSGATP